MFPPANFRSFDGIDFRLWATGADCWTTEPRLQWASESDIARNGGTSHARCPAVDSPPKRIGVWQVGDAYVPIIPKPKNSPKHYVTLRQFIRYKAFHCRIDPNKLIESLERSAVRFKSWIDTTRCDGEGDPRCLPFHVFKTDLEEYDLDTPAGRRGFARRYGQQGNRTDGNGIRWERPVARQMHGQPVLQVAGRTLTRGFHWDVTSSRRKSKSWTLATTSEEWEIERNGHVNVYPNAQIRGSKASRRIFSI